MPPDPDDIAEYNSRYAGCLSEGAQKMLRDLMQLRPDQVRGAFDRREAPQPCDHHNAQLMYRRETHYCPDCGQTVTR